MAESNIPALPPEVQQAIDAHNNRKRYPEFDLAVLSQIKDAELEQALLDYIFAKLKAKPGHDKRVIDGLSKGFQIFYATWLVEAEVLNGGFNQYFWNSSSEFAEVTADALKDIGDTVASDLMQRALKTAKSEIPAISKYKKQGTPQAFSDSYKETKLNEFDSPFWKRAEAFPALRIRYVREHPNLFLTR